PPAYFLATTIGRLGKDFLDKIWQRWRPSAEARKRGPVAVLLERLVYRDGRSFDEACHDLETRRDVTATRQELEGHFRALPSRERRRLIGEVALVGAPTKEPSPEQAAIG